LVLAPPHVLHKSLRQDIGYLHEPGYSGLGDFEPLTGVEVGSLRVFGKERLDLEGLGYDVLWDRLWR